MNCPSCSTLLEPNARFCGVCGYRLQASRAATPSGNGIAPPAAAAPKPVTAQPSPTAPPQAQKAPARPGRSSRVPKADELYIDKVLNNRFKVEAKIGEGGFGAVYRGTQLATNRKVALKLLHPEMTKDENLVSRFRREGMVLCNLRDAHTITTYDFDQTPDGTLYIAMELLEGKSLHQVFHEQAPLEWKRMFKILIEMCSSLAEAHAQGIVHRDLKPENVYLESRPGNPEFVKILDFGIAKVMKGDSIDPQSPQLTATGQTLGTLEYMSPEQLMGRQLDGRSDVYALGVLAYEMMTGRLPFPDAKGPAGLITAQLKQTPQPLSVANPKANLPAHADRVILKCLEKDKNNRHADVTQLAIALQEVIDHAREGSNPLATPLPSSNSSAGFAPQGGAELSNMAPSPAPAASGLQSYAQPAGAGAGARAGLSTPPAGMAVSAPVSTPMASYPQAAPNHAVDHVGHGAGAYPPGAPPQTAPQAVGAPTQVQQAAGGSSKLVWWVLGLLVLGAGVGAIAALFMQ